MNSKNLRPGKQRGQSIAEFVAVIGVFFVMMLSISYIAKMGSIGQNVREAAIHTVFELQAPATSDALIGHIRQVIR